MHTVLLVIHLILALAMIGLVLIQRSEGGGLGIGGGGGGMGGFATPQGTANMLTRATAICAGCFFLTSLGLVMLAGTHSTSRGILERSGIEDAPATVAVDEPLPAAPVEGEAPAPQAPIAP